MLIQTNHKIFMR